MGTRKIHEEDIFTTGPRIAALPPELCRAPLHPLYEHTQQHRTWNGHRFWSRSSRMVSSKNYILRMTGSLPRVHCEGPARHSSHQCLTRMLLDQQSELVQEPRNLGDGKASTRAKSKKTVNLSLPQTELFLPHVMLMSQLGYTEPVLVVNSPSYGIKHGYCRCPKRDYLDGSFSRGRNSLSELRHSST